MTTARIGPDHQITLPETVLQELPAAVGDLLEIETRGGMIVMRPVTSGEVSALTPDENDRLGVVRRRIERIRSDLASAPGLSAGEAKLAVRAGLIAEDERWWWQEGWLAKEREAEREIREGRIEVFDN